MSKQLRAATRSLAPLAMVVLLSAALAQDWSSATDGTFVALTASAADARHLPQVFDVLQEARQDLRQRWGLELPDGVTIVIYPNLNAYTAATAMPWFVVAVADRSAHTVHTQRLRVLLERHALETSLRHELFHLAQPETWARWRAEGEAMRFAGEMPLAQPLPHLGDEALDALLGAPPSREMLLRAMATAYQRVWQSDR